MTSTDIPLPEGGDVVELILDDHRLFEDLLRVMRDKTADRADARHAFATLHIAHAEAEEAEVYPTLRKEDAIDKKEAEHGKEEHAEGNEALLAVLEIEDVDSEEFDEKLEELAKRVNHHLTEEELTILNPAREEVDEDDRERLGAAFVKARNGLVVDDCGKLEKVRAVVAEARKKGLLEE